VFSGTPSLTSSLSVRDFCCFRLKS
jgi:hypothetical protein